MGRIYENLKEAVNEIERDITEMGIVVHPHTMQNKVVKDDDDYATLEVQNYSFCILNLDNKSQELSPKNLKWCRAEFLERVASEFTNPGKAWSIRADVWQEFLVDGKMDYTYNERINYMQQLQKVIKELKENPDSRQCIIHLNFPEDSDHWRKRRIPCSLTYQLMIRRGKLDIIYNMRSGDFDTHFKNDIWLADELRNYIALELGIQPGLYHMNIASLHRYKNYTKEHIF